MAAHSVPALRDIVARLCVNLDSIRAGCINLPSSASVALDQATRCCSELICASDHLALYAELSGGRQPNFSICDTSAYFRELLDAVRRLLGTRAPQMEIRGHHSVLIDHDMVGRILLLLIANGLEHGDGDLSVSILLSPEEMTLTVSNHISAEAHGKTAGIGLGLTLVDMVASLHHGTCTVSDQDDHFVVVVTLPSAHGEEVSSISVRTETQYLTDRFSMVYLEMDKYARPKSSTDKKKSQSGSSI